MLGNKKMDFTKLKVGDKVLLDGTIFTARDKAHLFLLKQHFPKLENSIIYHCGPIIKDNQVISSGPTTSARLSPYTPELIEKYNIKAIIGKGGMNNEVLEALKGKAVYLSAIGGAGVIYARCMTLKGVDKLEEFGMPEAIWEFEVKDFPVIVTMDSKGNNLHDKVKHDSKKILDSLLG